jgi:hypothetical protein
MRYFQKSGTTYGYDTAVATDAIYIAAAITAGWTEITGNWPPSPTLQQVQTNQSAVLTQACANAILSGFTSSALGSAYIYPCKSTDQQNLAASVAKSQLVPSATFPFWCADSSGAWAMRNHTATQIQQVGIDAYASVLSAQQKLTNLVAEVMAATSADAVQSIVW